MIPKIIHYCWFGGKPLPPSALKCKKSWETFFPDYEIKEWNEGNFDVGAHEYTRYCYEHELWAYLSDYVRLAVVEKEGGLYFDTDVEVVKRPQELLSTSRAYFGWETREYINTGLGFAAEAHHPAIQAMLEMYEGLVVNGVYMHERLQGCPQLNTKALVPTPLSAYTAFSRYALSSVPERSRVGTPFAVSISLMSNSLEKSKGRLSASIVPFSQIRL